MSRVVAEAYHIPDVREAFAHTYRTSRPLDEIIGKLDAELADGRSLAGYMDDWYERAMESARAGGGDQAYGAWADAAHVLTSLPPDVLFEAYGEEALVWAAVNTTLSEHSRRHMEVLRDRAGYDLVALEQARLWQWRMCGSHLCRDVLAQYALYDRLHDGALGAIDLRALVLAHAAGDSVISAERAADYQLEPVSVQDARDVTGRVGNQWPVPDPNAAYDIWLDAPVGFVLTYKGRPQAIVGLGMSSSGELMIYQLQGVRAQVFDDITADRPEIVRQISSRGLAPLEWRHLMVDITTQLALSLGLDSIAIQEGAQNEWVRPRRGEAAHLTLESAQRTYDETARELGFTRGADNNWHLALATSAAAS